MDFREKVYNACRKIPRGKVATYGEIAGKTGHPGAARAVGNALNKNPDPMAKDGTIPCHRVICSNGKIGGFAFGANKKIQLLKKEGHKIKNGKLVSKEL